MSLGRGLESLIPKKNEPAENADVSSVAQENTTKLNPSDTDSDNPGLQTSVLQNHTDTDVSKYRQSPESIFYIEVSRIKPNPHQPRREFNEEALEALAASIQKHGILQPLVVTKHEIEKEYGRGVEYHIVAGERRWRAAKMAGFNQVPVIVRETTEQSKLELALIENIQRDDLNPIEEARAYQQLAQKFNLTQQAIADQVGKSRSVIANKMRLLGLPYDVQQLLFAENNIAEGHAKVLLSVDNPEKQLHFAQKVISDDLSVRALERVVKKDGAPARKSTPHSASSADPELESYKKKIQETLGASVAISGSREKGRLAISFHSPEEFRAIIERLIQEE